MEKKKSSKKLILAIVILTVLVVALLLVSALLVFEKNQNKALDTELTSDEMELYIRRFSSEKRSELALKEQQDYDAMIEERKNLRDEMLKNDEEDLLTIVNPWNPVPEDWEFRTVKIGRRGIDEDMFLDERAAGALCSMLKDCEADGCRPVPISAFRTTDYQQKLFDGKVQREIMNGVSADRAEDSAADEVARPGYSEHELGLSVDIIDDYYQDLDLMQEWTNTQRWLMANSMNYGFILRYPNGTTETTGIVYEPWHYRYVGKSVALDYINSGAATFEDYIAGR